MWIDLGIDTGNILTTEFTELTGDESFLEIHLKVVEHAHSLYLKAIKHLAEGKKNDIPQSAIAKGKTYYTKEWTLGKKIKLISNLKKMKDAFRSGKVANDRQNVSEYKI